MRSVGVIGDQPVGGFSVTAAQGGKEQVLVEGGEGVLERAVEALGMSVHPRRLRRGTCGGCRAVFGISPTLLQTRFRWRKGAIGVRNAATEGPF